MQHNSEVLAPRVGEPETSEINGVANFDAPEAVTQSRRVAEELSSAPACPLVLIEWEDSVQPCSQWQALSDWKPSAVVRIASVGWLIKDGEDVKALAPNMGGIDELTTVQVSGVIHIPTRCVLSVKPLSE